MPGLLESFVLLALTSAGLSGGALSIAVPAVVGAIGIGLSVGVSYLSALLFKPEQPKPEDVQVTIKSPTAPRASHYGRGKVSGSLAFLESKSGRIYKIIALGTGEVDAIEEYWVDDRLVTLDGSGWVNSGGELNGQVRIQSRRGLPTETYYSSLEAEFPEWDNTHRGDGVASILVEQTGVPAEDFTEVFPNGANTLYRVVLRGRKVFNPSTGTTVWSENAAAIIRDYMTHADGMRLPVSLMTTPQAAAGWLAAYNRCAEAVPLKAGGTEERYRLWGTYKFDERPADVLGRMLACCDGRIIPTPDGGVTLDIGAWEEPTVTIDEDTITGFSELSRGRDILTTANVISATFLSPQHDYQGTDADQWRDEDDVDNRGEIVSDIALNMAPSHGQARRLMKLAAYRANPSWIGTFQCNLKTLAAFGKRLVRITYPLFGIDEVFEVVDFRFILGEGGILQSVSLQVTSMPQEAYAWNAATEEGTAPISEEVTVDRTIPVPQGFTFTEGTVTVGGQNYSVGVITFDPPPSESLKVEGQFKKVSDPDTAWEVIPIAQDSTSAQTGVLEDGVQYEARVRHTTITGRNGEWTDPTLKMTPLSDPVAPKNLVSFTLTGSAPRLGNAAFSFTTQNDDHLRHIALYRVASGGVLNKATDLVLKIPVTTAASTYNYVDGDGTRTNLLTDGAFNTAIGAGTWSQSGSGWNIAGGKATKTPGSASALQQALSPTAGSTYRTGLIVSGFVAGTLRARFTGGTTVDGANVGANGAYLQTLVAVSGNNTFGIVASATFDGAVDDAAVYLQTAACAPAGVWDYYAEPLNPSGVAGTLAGPVTVTVV